MNNSIHELRVDLGDGHDRAFAKYDRFLIGPESDGYRLTAQQYSGDAGDALWYHDGLKFSTKNRDNDLWRPSSCARERKGGWWYNACYWANLNGRYRPNVYFSEQGIIWVDWKGWEFSLKFSEMKFREHARI